MRFILLRYQVLDDKAKKEKGWECSTLWKRRELRTGFGEESKGERTMRKWKDTGVLISP